MAADTPRENSVTGPGPTAAAAIIEFAARVSKAPWSERIRAQLAAALVASTDPLPRLLLEHHLDGSARVDVSISRWSPGDEDWHFDVAGAHVSGGRVRGTELDVTDQVSVMGVFTSTQGLRVQALPPGLGPVLYVGRSHRQPGVSRCIVAVRERSGLASAFDHFELDATAQIDATGQLGACEQWLADGAMVRLALDVTAEGDLVRDRLGVELFDHGDRGARGRSLEGFGIAPACLHAAQGVWASLPSVEQVRLEPRALPGLHLDAGKIQATHSHVKVTLGRGRSPVLKTYSEVTWHAS